MAMGDATILSQVLDQSHQKIEIDARLDADDGLNIHFVERTQIQARKYYARVTRGVDPNSNNRTSSSSNGNLTNVPTSGGSGGKVVVVDSDDGFRWIVPLLNCFFGDVWEGGNTIVEAPLTTIGAIVSSSSSSSSATSSPNVPIINEEDSLLLG